MLETYGQPAALFAAFAAFYLFASRQAARPADPLKPRMAPWRTISVVAGFCAIIALLVLVSRFGVAG